MMWTMRSPATSLALAAAVLGAVAATALAADSPTPAVCGSSGCTPLSTATLQGLLTLPAALRPAATPPAQPYFRFSVEDPEGATRDVLYVPRAGAALLGFAAPAGWRRVPADDARLLADAVAGTTPYPAPPAGTTAARLFAGTDTSGRNGTVWLVVAALVGVAVTAVALAARRAARRAAALRRPR
jgi:hypothetical protein